MYIVQLQCTSKEYKVMPLDIAMHSMQALAYICPITLWQY